MKTCGNCAWYCHADGRCYGRMAEIGGHPIGMGPGIRDNWACSKWAADGLTDEEREEYTLMTKE